ncbi:hypothetical protein EDF62_1583 [Leucobacter luti]|uniref:Uncharacterized protein n=1 Tax=Leucobacter luti TaxID=340320 RepID=A0A4R6S169_9MICO|nr:hypothetical protein EDF62_1583 [Leucobacter luti]
MLRSDWQVAPFEPSLCGPIGITDGVAWVAKASRTHPSGAELRNFPNGLLGWTQQPWEIWALAHPSKALWYP